MNAQSRWIPIAPGPVDLRQVCAQVLGELDISPGIEIRRELAGDLIGTWDADRLAEVLPVLFSPFRRGEQSNHSKAGNLGLGLYIAQEIMRSHGGTLTVQSAGGATTFTLRLPRSQGR